MRHGGLVLLAWLSLIASASAQTTSPPETVFVPFFGSAVMQTARVSGDALVARLMSFDRNSDGRVASDELLERLQHLMARGDADGDGALDDREIRALTSTSPASAGTVRGFGIGQYAVGSDISLSSRAHIEGALDDLTLTESVRLQAIAISKEFLSAFNDGAVADLLKDMESLLMPEHLADFKRTLEGHGVRPAADLAAHIGRYQLAPRQNHLAHAALGRLGGERRMDDRARSQLVERMKGILTEEERDDLLAALGRRPVVKVGHLELANALGVVERANALSVVMRPVE
jgi:hypothetical protein